VGMEETPALLAEGVLDGPCQYPRTQATQASTAKTLTGTLTSASTSTITDSNADWDFSQWHGDPAALGTPVEVVASNGTRQRRRIKSITATTKTITVQSAFTNTPSAGDKYVIGGVDWQIKLGTFDYPEREEQQTRRVLVDHKPLTYHGAASLRRYHNHSTSPETAAWADNNNAGVSVAAGASDWQLDLTKPEGKLLYRFDDRYEGEAAAKRCVDVELRGVAAQESVEIYGLDLEGVEAGGQ